jgi:hypothetical protein
MSLVNSNTEKWYQSRMLWLGLVQVAAAAATAILTDVEPEVWVAGIFSGIATVILRLNTKDPITK